MTPKSRKQITKLHVIFAGFFLPVGIAFSVTGGLYTFDVKGKYNTKTIEVENSFAEIPTLESAIALAKQILIDQKSPGLPSGNPALKKIGTSWQFEWTGARYDFTIEPTLDSSKLSASIKNTNWHRFFVQLHKAKGGYPMKLLAGGLALGFLMLFASGIAMAFSNPNLKKILFRCLTLGILAFALAAYFS